METSTVRYPLVGSVDWVANVQQQEAMGWQVRLIADRGQSIVVVFERPNVENELNRLVDEMPPVGDYNAT